ncbi:MAG: RNA-binding transcriptional accessory protein, partial [Gemmatimonadetes bacterium]|nr:RNA-binding transcriptional accessory protein [Gemmatimonadota bacterium]
MADRGSTAARIASDLSLHPRQVAAALGLFDEGATVPFAARYRKEVTGGLDEVQLRDVLERSEYLEELEDRRTAILKSIEEQGRLDDALSARIRAADTKQALEDLYLPYKPKRRTRAIIARERGLEALAELMWAGAAGDAEMEREATAYVDEGKGVADVEAALQGARDILAERVAEDAALRAWVRDRTRAAGIVTSKARGDRDPSASKFADYFQFSQKLTDIPSHRVLAIRRGETEEELSWTIEAPVDELTVGLTKRVVTGRAAVRQLTLVAADSYRRLLASSIEVELRLELKSRADEEAIRIFGANLEQLLLGAPAGGRVVLGLDPGFRTGVKAALVSRTGAVLDTETLYLHQEDNFARALTRLVQQHGIELIAIGNGTASRETETLVKRTVQQLAAPRPQVLVVNESGASVYSASDIAREEMPDLDVSMRGAPSIARRLQDPLAELVKIDPKSIGVGQYQHDVNQSRLKKRLDEVVETCVNRVGVELNTASAPLLSYVAGVGDAVARNIVTTRDQRGGFRSRRELLEVPRLGARAFEQAAGFLRVRGGDYPLDATAVHPERYGLVERMAADLGAPVSGLVQNDALIDRLDLSRYVSEDVGMPTLRDIADELRRPGRDPRDSFELPEFRDDITSPKDLKQGMKLEGVVTNLVAFGAFVDIGVHQDGLVHVSQLADR